mgnify:CR=1 FL=1
MRTTFVIGADLRETQGKGASRRLRRAGKVPAILYGGHEPPQPLILDQQNLLTMVDKEQFYSSIVQIRIGERSLPAVVKDVQMHPARNIVVHVDLQRVLENEPIRLPVPIHFRNENTAPGVKLQGGILTRVRTEVEVECLPKDLPEYLEVDLSQMNINETKFLSDIPLPPGVTIPELKQGRNTPVVSIHSPRTAEAEEVAAAEGAEAAAAAPAAAEKEAGGGAAKKEGGGKK